MRAHSGKQRQRRRMKKLGEVGLAQYFRTKRSDDKRWFLQDWRLSQACSGMSHGEAWDLCEQAKEGRAR